MKQYSWSRLLWEIISQSERPDISCGVLFRSLQRRWVGHWRGMRENRWHINPRDPAKYSRRFESGLFTADSALASAAMRLRLSSCCLLISLRVYLDWINVTWALFILSTRGKGGLGGFAQRSRPGSGHVGNPVSALTLSLAAMHRLRQARQTLGASHEGESKCCCHPSQAIQSVRHKSAASPQPCGTTRWSVMVLFLQTVEEDASLSHEDATQCRGLAI